MTTPLDPSSALERLIAAEQAVTPSEAARAANWAGVHARLAAAPASAATVGGALKLLAAAAGGGAVLAALALSAPSPGEPPAAAPAVMTREPVPEHMPALPAATHEPPIHEPIPTLPTPADDGSWDAELTHLQGVQAALREGRAAAVLVQVDEYVRRWPAGVFIEEIEAAHVLATCASGGDVAARRALAAFLRRWPESLYGARVRGSCDDRDPP